MPPARSGPSEARFLRAGPFPGAEARDYGDLRATRRIFFSRVFAEGRRLCRLQCRAWSLELARSKPQAHRTPDMEGVVVPLSQVCPVASASEAPFRCVLAGGERNKGLRVLPQPFKMKRFPKCSLYHLVRRRTQPTRPTPRLPRSDARCRRAALSQEGSPRFAYDHSTCRAPHSCIRTPIAL